MRMEDHAKMVSLDTTVLVNKGLLGTIVNQVCMKPLSFDSMNAGVCVSFRLDS